mmetsp:Transcript_6166/g.10556  ORF Transcript_6166/g.10556 Transcript_6166/m.10556 type:complete len:90 (+) Transcript_6166:374-643(+)
MLVLSQCSIKMYKDKDNPTSFVSPKLIQASLRAFALKLYDSFGASLYTAIAKNVGCSKALSPIVMIPSINAGVLNGTWKKTNATSNVDM